VNQHRHSLARNREIVSNGTRETDPKGTLPDGKVEGDYPAWP
jgi:hypothetical protein